MNTLPFARLLLAGLATIAAPASFAQTGDGAVDHATKAPAPPAPEPSASHRDRIAEPPLPDELRDAGTVYHTISGDQTQVTFTSNGQLQQIVGKSNAVVGYAVAGAVDAPAKLAGARWLLPVESLATGIPLRDDHLAHKWLRADEHPTIDFTLTSTEDIEPVKSGPGYSTWSLTLVGRMTIRGETRVIRVTDAKLSFLKESESTAKVAPGDLCFLKCEYRLKLSDFGIHDPDVPSKVSDEIGLVQLLRMTTIARRPSGEEPQRQGPAGTGAREGSAVDGVSSR